MVHFTGPKDIAQALRSDDKRLVSAALGQLTEHFYRKNTADGRVEIVDALVTLVKKRGHENPAYESLEGLEALHSFFNFDKCVTPKYDQTAYADFLADVASKNESHGDVKVRAIRQLWSAYELKLIDKETVTEKLRDIATKLEKIAGGEHAFRIEIGMVDGLLKHLGEAARPISAPRHRP